MKRKQQPKRQRLGERGEGRFVVMRKQRPTHVSLTFGTRVGSGVGAERAVMVREAGGFLERDRPMARWAAVASCKQAHGPLLFPDLQAMGR